MPKANIGEDISDPSDFKGPSCGELRSLDLGLRCPICKDFYHGPVLLSGCGHSFCSLCIREVLGTKKECPDCRQPVSELQLKRNLALETVVDCWFTARSKVLDFIDKSRDEPNVRPAQNSSDTKLEAGSIECPICCRMLHMQDINRHLDSNCTWNGSTDKAAGGKNQWANIFASKATAKGKEKASSPPPEESFEPPERLPLVSYDVMKDKDIRNLLKSQGLHADGDSETLRTRHKRWVTLYNANLDITNPRSSSELKGDLRNWERDMSDSKKKEKLDRGTTRDTALYAKRHASDFTELIQEVRKRRKKNTTEEAATDSPSGTSPTSPLPKDAI